MLDRLFASPLARQSARAGGRGDVEEIKSVPYAPVSHPFVERLIGTIRREFLDRVLFWNAVDLARKLKEYENYYNAYRVRRSLGGTTPAQCSKRIAEH
jgi:putative transposase